jgi:cytochrome b561
VTAAAPTTSAAPPRPDTSDRTARRPGGPAVPATGAVLLLIHLVVLAEVPAPLRALLVLPAAVLLPGAWTLRVLRLRRPRGWDTLLHAVAFGLCCLLAVSFAVAVLPVPGALSPGGCLVGLDLAMAALITTAAVRDRRSGLTRTHRPLRSFLAPVSPWPSPGRTPGGGLPPGSAAVALAGLAVVLAVVGARHLNRDGGAPATVLAFTLAAMALLLIASPGRAAVGAAARSSEQWTATAVYLLGLAVLLATSLRGIGVTGHDIKIEMHVLQSTLAAGRWQPGGMAPDYTSCLSITTLPALLHHLSGLAPLDIFRVCYQALFALVGVGAFLVARRLLPVAGAAAAAGLFIAFPAFVNDMPMLNRQELALIFFTVAVLALLDQRGPRRQRVVTFVVMGAGLTVSHYSSTYVAVGILVFGLVLLRMPIPARRLPDRLLAVVPAWRPDVSRAPLLTARLVAVLVVLSVGWSMCSGSGGGLVRTVTDTLVAVQRSNGASADAVGYSLFGPRVARTDEQALRDYIATRGAQSDPGVLNRLAITCPTVLTPTDVLPVTLAGRAVQAAGITPATANLWARRGAVALFQLGAVLGVLLLLAAGRPRRGPTHVLACLGGGASMLLAATVLLPQLSLNYGLLRLFQQSLVLLAPLIVLAATTLLGAVTGTRRAAVGSAVLVTACFVSTSGLLPQFIGGYQPQLNLNNSGPYYRAWYATADDVAVARWVGDRLAAGSVLAADSAETALLRATTRIDPREGVAPGIVAPDAYLMVTTTGGGDRVQAVAVADDRILVFTFPLTCVTTGRPLLFARNDHRVYGPTTLR